MLAHLKWDPLGTLGCGWVGQNPKLSLKLTNNFLHWKHSEMLQDVRHILHKGGGSYLTLVLDAIMPEGLLNSLFLREKGVFKDFSGKGG